MTAKCPHGVLKKQTNVLKKMLIIYIFGKRMLKRYRKKLLMFVCLVVFIYVINLFSTHTNQELLCGNFTNYSFRRTVIKQRGDLMYDPKNPEDDRIPRQMNHIPGLYKQFLEKGIRPKCKRILRYYGFNDHPFYGGEVVPGTRTFEKCPVNRCEVFTEKQKILEMDAVVFEYDHPDRTWKCFPPHQIWVMYKSESPYLSWGLSSKDEMNWTATYRKDSTLVVPYYKFISNPSLSKPTNTKNYAKGKTKMVAMFVSNCRPSNNRMQYAKELGQYIAVDIYGRCGSKICPRSSPKCFEMLQKEYKFYLAFENCNCRHYITEKFFLNGLLNDILPVVMGASPFDYKMVAPPNSFIHVEEFHSPKELAEYLHKLDKNDTLYNEYFKWKGSGTFMTGQTSEFWCRLCSMLHDQDFRPPSWYEDVNEWWRGKGVCIGSDYWRNHAGSNTSLQMKPAVID